jgi:Na+-driven multidrug efflux pump
VEHTEKTKLIAKNTGFMAFRMMVVVAVGLFTSRIVLDALGIDDYGIYGVVGSVVVFLSFFKNALTNATYRFFTFDLGRNDFASLGHTFSMSLNMHLLLAMVMLVLLEIGGLIFINHYLNISPNRIEAANWVFQFSLLAFCIEILKTPYNSCVIAHERMNFFAYTSLAEGGMGLFNAYLLWMAPTDKLIFYAMLQFVLSLLLFIWYYVYCRIHFAETQHLFIWDKTMLRKLISYSGWSLLVNAADVIAVQCINIFLNWFGCVAVNAAMGIANQVSSKMNMFLGSFTQAFNPQIIKSYASGDTDYFFKLIFSTSKFSFFLLFAMAFPMCLFVDFVLDVWLVDVPVYSNVFIVLMLCYYLVDAVQSPLWQAAHATGRIAVHQILISTVKILSIPIVYLLLRYGLPYWTAVAVWAAMNMVAAIARTTYMRILIQLPVGNYLKEVIGRLILVTVCSVPLPYVIYTQVGNGWWQLFAVTVVFLVIYSVSIYVVGLSLFERDLIKKVFNQKFKISGR